MFRRRRIRAILEKFRQREATSPEKAMTVEELNLPPRFKKMMNRRLGKLGIFVEVDGKYYLSEERLKEVRERRKKKTIERVVIQKEIVKVKCPYCGTLYELLSDTCPHCGARRQ